MQTKFYYKIKFFCKRLIMNRNISFIPAIAWWLLTGFRYLESLDHFLTNHNAKIYGLHYDKTCWQTNKRNIFMILTQNYAFGPCQRFWLLHSKLYCSNVFYRWSLNKHFMTWGISNEKWCSMYHDIYICKCIM